MLISTTYRTYKYVIQHKKDTFRIFFVYRLHSITIALLQIYKRGDISMDTNVLVPYKQTCTAGEEQQSQQFRKYEATFVTLVHDPSNEMVLLRTVLQEKIIFNHSVLRHSVNSLTANEINSYFWKRSAQQVIISGLVVLKADPVANNPTQSTGGRNRIPWRRSSIENKFSY